MKELVLTDVFSSSYIYLNPYLERVLRDTIFAVGPGDQKSGSRQGHREQEGPPGDSGRKELGILMIDVLVVYLDSRWGRKGSCFGRNRRSSENI